jgi:drug/metabolite transporter (DMT)-like permease
MNGRAPSRIPGHPMPEVVLRTRRSVMEAAQQMQARRTQKRRQMGYALLALGVLVVLAAPALWSGYTDLASGEQFTDMPLMLLTLSLVLLSAMFAVLLMSWRGRRRGAGEDER